jgi:hypothetical protein
MAKYLKLVRSTISWFDEVTFVQVPREQNTEADALAKLASSDVAINQQIEVQYSPSHTEEELHHQRQRFVDDANHQIFGGGNLTHKPR